MAYLHSRLSTQDLLEAPFEGSTHLHVLPVLCWSDGTNASQLSSGVGFNRLAAATTASHMALSIHMHVEQEQQPIAHDTCKLCCKVNFATWRGGNTVRGNTMTSCSAFCSVKLTQVTSAPTAPSSVPAPSTRWILSMQQNHFACCLLDFYQHRLQTLPKLYNS